MKKPALIIGILFFLLIGLVIYNTYYGIPRLPRVSKAMIPPPVIITLNSSNAPLRVFPGAGNVAFLLPDNSLWRWGMSHGPGINLTVPTLVETNSSWRQILTANNHTVAIHTNGTLWEWGWRGGPRYVKTPQQVNPDHDWISVTAGDLHAVALKKDGTLWAWGDTLAPLRDSAIHFQTNLVQLGTNKDWIAVGGGGQTTFALRKDHTLWVLGQVYDPYTSQTTNFSTLTQFSSDTNWLPMDGESLFRPRNSKGEVYYTPFTAPHPTKPVAQFAQLIAKDVFTDQIAYAFTDKPKIFTLHPDGTLWEMDIHYRNGLLAPSYKWKRFGGRSDWVSLWEAGGTALALSKDGTLWMWGCDIGQQPIPDTRSRIQQLKNRILSFLRIRPSSTTVSASLPLQPEPRLLLRLVYANTNQVTAKE